MEAGSMTIGGAAKSKNQHVCETGCSLTETESNILTAQVEGFHKSGAGPQNFREQTVDEFPVTSAME